MQNSTLFSSATHNLPEAMQDYTWLVFLPAVVVGYIVAVSRDPLQKVPGPLLARWSNLWQAFYTRFGIRYKAIHAVHKTYGPVVRISPNHVSIADMSLLPSIYGQGMAAFNKSPFYDAFLSEKPSIFSTRDKQEHAQKRRNYSGAFAPKTIRSYTTTVHRFLEELLVKLDKRAALPGEPDKAPIDMLIWSNYLVFDIMSTLAFGTPLGMLEKESDVLQAGSPKGAIENTDVREHYLTVIGWAPALAYIARLIPDPFFQKGSKSSDELRDIARMCIKQRLASGSDDAKSDILGHLIAAHMEYKNHLDVEELTSEALTLLIAGTDATSNAITAIIHALSVNPRPLAKLREELDEALSPGGLQGPTSDLNDLPYLNACIHEAIRLHSPTGMGLPRIVPEGGLTYRDYYFPPGTDVSVPTWTMSRDRAAWGEDADVFRPERWIEDPSLTKYFMAFSSGTRGCLGKSLAILELKMIVATLLQRYDITPQSLVLQTTEKLMHKPTHDWVRLRRRNVD
ncbi:cytochrome P450 [Punctularia strigosozonata HHB-11173 SS5]|uniref:cytochrome P450 n=1 Tax=Punctularia strigosozonata (strain HHB-11173) TaxID=741275 RepID=UPI0004417502|nr:cytochrome P450 [Punctularia strigosozonata HHB-11173 SS5]EIN09534.1 cytochrome P450 [Punctularia strigosozonata HHB-11173 SS5]